LSQFTCLTDGQTDGILIARLHLHELKQRTVNKVIDQWKARSQGWGRVFVQTDNTLNICLT